MKKYLDYEGTEYLVSKIKDSIKESTDRITDDLINILFESQGEELYTLPYAYTEDDENYSVLKDLATYFSRQDYDGCFDRQSNGIPDGYFIIQGWDVTGENNYKDKYVAYEGNFYEEGLKGETPPSIGNELSSDLSIVDDLNINMYLKVSGVSSYYVLGKYVDDYEAYGFYIWDYTTEKYFNDISYNEFCNTYGVEKANSIFPEDLRNSYGMMYYYTDFDKDTTYIFDINVQLYGDSPAKEILDNPEEHNFNLFGNYKIYVPKTLEQIQEDLSFLG